ncbi:MAG: 5'/3'-nucleotidase SurE, partial [Pontibacterium sp.]
LAKALSADHAVCVVAPDRNRSGASNSLTLGRPLELYKHENGFYGVDGTPTDCVHLGASEVLGFHPDIVVSGINAGPNMGDDVLYSGTVAAATEGRHFRYPPVAVSSANFHPAHYDAAAEIIRQILSQISQLNVAPRTVLNVNVPDLPLDELQGVHITRLGHRHPSEPPVKAADPRGRERFWIAGVGDIKDGEPGTDFFAVENGYVSITPLQIDMTQYAAMDNLASWVEETL